MNSIVRIIRNFTRNKVFTLINILGLSLGFLCYSLIYIYILNEQSYDSWHVQKDRIYRINQTFIWGDDDDRIFSSTGPGVAEALKKDIPEIEEVIRIHTPDNVLPLTLEGESDALFSDEVIYAVDKGFFNVFDYKLIVGNPKTSLEAANSAVLKKSTAIKIFGDINPIGQLINLGEGDNKSTYKITGIVEDKNSNSYVDFDILLSLNSFPRVKRQSWSWMWTQFETFILVKENTNEEQLALKIDKLPEEYATKTLNIMGFNSLKDYNESGKNWNLYLQKLEDIHLYSTDIYNRLSNVGNYKIVIVMAFSGIFVIILSCINFINLTTAQFSIKAKNSSIRKILGSSNFDIQLSYFIEAFIFCAISAFLSILVLQIILPSANNFLDLDLTLKPENQIVFYSLLFLVVLTVSIISAVYPAIFFSSFNPVSLMKGEMKHGKNASYFRNGMMIVQYSLSLLLISCSIIVYQQLNFFYTSDPGFKKDNVIVVNNINWASSNINEKSKVFTNELKSVNGVEMASLCDATPLFVYMGDQFAPVNPSSNSIPLNFVVADENYVPVLELDLKIGRNFDKNISTDIQGVLLNETAIASLGWVADSSILNKKIANWSGEYKVIGIVKDFNFWSLQSPIEPFAIFHSESNAMGGRPLTNVALKLNTKSHKDYEKTISDIESLWTQFSPNRPFEYTIIDQVFESTFQSEARFGKIIGSFAIMTVLIAMMGFLGMFIFSIQQRIKEIGIRKVLGADAFNIFSIFSRSYFKLIIISMLISSPLAYFFMNNWLDDFSYRIQIDEFVFIYSGIVLLLISAIISIYHTFKAFLINPSLILKDE